MSIRVVYLAASAVLEMQRGIPDMRRKWILAVVIVMASLVFGACAGGGSSEKAAPAERGSTGSAPPMQGAPTNDAAAPQPGAPAGDPNPVPLDRKIIKNASFDIQIKDGDAAVNKITASVTGAGGYVQDVKQSGTAHQGRKTNITRRGPAVAFVGDRDLGARFVQELEAEAARSRREKSSGVVRPGLGAGIEHGVAAARVRLHGVRGPHTVA